MFGHEVLQAVRGVFCSFGGQTGVQRGGYLHIIISVYAEDVFDYVAGALDVDAVGGYVQGESVGCFGYDLHLEAGDDVFNRGLGDGFADEVVDVLVGKLDAEGWELCVADVFDVAGDGASGEFLDHDGGEFQAVDDVVGVDAAFEAEGCVGVQAVAAGGFTYPGGMEVGAFEEDVGGVLGGAGGESAEDSGDAHGFVGVAYHEVAVAEAALGAVECDEGCAFGQGAYDDLAAFHLGCVEAVEGLAEGVYDVVGDVDHVVDGAQADGAEFVLEPLGAFADGDAADGDAGVAGTGFGVVDVDGDVEVVVVDGEGVYRGSAEGGGVSVLPEPGAKVAGYAVV